MVITNKGMAIGITASCLCFLCFVQMPFLALCYFCAGVLRLDLGTSRVSWFHCIRV